MTLSDMQEEDDAMPDPDELIGAKFQKFQCELKWRAEMKATLGLITRKQSSRGIWALTVM